MPGEAATTGRSSTLRGPLVAMGGGYIGEPANTYSFARPPDGKQRWPVETTAIDMRVLTLAKPRNGTVPRVLLVPTATEDSERHDLASCIEAFIAHYETLGAAVDVLRLLPQRDRDSAIAAKIAFADIVYVSGGLTHQLVATWQTLKIEPMLRAASAR